jgi:hypothetical protein
VGTASFGSFGVQKRNQSNKSKEIHFPAILIFGSFLGNKLSLK